MSRWKAAAIHFIFSALVAGAVLVTFVLLWYPPEIFSAAGATRLAQLLIGVDVVLGPLLTLIVFRAGKRSLKFDISVIVLLQLAALTYGLHAAWISRPIFIVATGDRLEWVTALQLTREQLAEAPTPEMREYPLFKPRMVASLLPSNPLQRSQINGLVFGGQDMQMQPRFYHPYADSVDELRGHFRPLDTLPKWGDPDVRKKVLARIKPLSLGAGDVVWLPLMLKERDVVVLLRASDGSWIAPIDTPGWGN